MHTGKALLREVMVMPVALQERQVRGAVKDGGMVMERDQRETLQSVDESAVAAIIRQLYESGALARHIMTVEKAASMFGVPFPTVNSWTRGNPQKSKNYLPVLEDITNKERLVLLSDFLACYANWKPRNAEDEPETEEDGAE